MGHNYDPETSLGSDRNFMLMKSPPRVTMVSVSTPG